MRILHLSTLYPPHLVGGAERSVALLAEQQVKLGHHVGAACLTPNGASRSERNGVSVYRMAHHNDFWMEEWPQHSQGERERAKFKQQFNFAIERSFGEVLDAFQPDILNTHSLVDVSTRTWLAAYRRGVPIVHTLRDYDLVCAASSMFRESGPCAHRHLKCRALTFTKGLDQRCVSAVTAVGKEVLRRHLELGFFHHVPEALRQVIWNTAEIEGVDPDYVRPQRPEGPFVFGYLGRISPEKGVETLLKACRLLPPEGWRLVVGGSAPGSMDAIRALAEGLPVSFSGFVEPKAFFEQVDVLVTPSLWAEPLGRTVLEAYRVGVPVLGSATGGIAELIDDPDWLSPAGDVPALAKRMAGVLDRGRKSLPAPGRFERVVSATGRQVVANRFLKIYRATLGKTARGLAIPARPERVRELTAGGSPPQ